MKAPLLAVTRPGGAFCRWAGVEGDAGEFARKRSGAQNVRVLTGIFLGDLAGTVGGRTRGAHP